MTPCAISYPVRGAKVAVLHIATLTGSDRLITLVRSRAGPLLLSLSVLRASQAVGPALLVWTKSSQSLESDTDKQTRQALITSTKGLDCAPELGSSTRSR